MLIFLLRNFRFHVAMYGC